MTSFKNFINKMMGKINKLAENKYMLILFIAFLIIQPILDIYVLFTDEVINIFKFSPSTIIRMVLIIGLFLILAFSDKNKKHLKYHIIFGILVVAYTVAHLYNCLHIGSNINPNYRVSLLSEIFYIIRMLLPLFVIYISFNYKMSFKQLSIIIITVVLLFSSILIFTHFTKLSLKSYVETNERITQTAIDWIFHPENVIKMEDSLSKGVFSGANQLGNLLIMLLPIALYITIKKTNFINCLAVFMQIFACILIGTRISSFSWVAVIVAIIIMMIFFSKVKREIKINKYLWVFIVITVAFNGYLLSKSPTLSRNVDDSTIVEQNKIENNTQGKLEDFNNMSDSDEYNSLKQEFIINNYTQFNIQRIFLTDIYDYKYDPDFWINVMNSPYEKYSNSRKMQFLIADRIFEVNNNPLDKLFGIGFSTTRNGNLYTEQDFYAHYYTLGIIGSLLLVFTQIFVPATCIIKILLNIKKNFTFENLIYVMSLSMIFVIALISAHVLDELVVTIFIGFILGQLLNNIFASTDRES